MRHPDALRTALPPTLVLTPTSRRPTTLREETVRTILAAPVPSASTREAPEWPPRVSIVVVTYDNLVFTRMCLESVLANTEAPTYELIVVDNASTDGTVEYLAALARCQPHVRVVFNDRNRGFAPANNQGLALARGDVLVLLNNDTIVPPGWLDRLVGHLGDPTIGLVGPVTSYAGNEARIETTYRTYGELERFARERAATHRGELTEIPQLEMFCLALLRDVFERLEPLDERYQIGMFEDDDYSLRARRAGYRVVCAEDTFVHHFGQASFGKLTPSGEYDELFRTNRARFEQKWGVPWEQHRARRNPTYDRLCERIGEVARKVLPPEATVLVISKGDEALLGLLGRSAWHFPRLADGSYAGCYPEDGAAAVEHLEALRRAGADWLLIPSPAFWWLDHYAVLARYLERRHTRVHACEACHIYSLSLSRAGAGPFTENHA
jgi:GT2 family glycosyltransferase